MASWRVRVYAADANAPASVPEVMADNRGLARASSRGAPGRMAGAPGGAAVTSICVHAWPRLVIVAALAGPWLLMYAAARPTRNAGRVCSACGVEFYNSDACPNCTGHTGRPAKLRPGLGAKRG